MRKLFIILATLIFVFNLKAYAHPGNTDANGGHYCWTNCEQWGLKYGEYHYHNSAATSSPVVKVAPSNTHTYKEGYDEAYSYWYQRALSELKENRVKDGWNATWTDYNKNYSDGYRDGFDKAIDDAKKDFKDYQYNRGVEDGKKDAKLDITMGYIASNDPITQSDDYTKGYDKGNFDEKKRLKEKQKENLENALGSVDISEKFQDKRESFILGYQTGFNDSKTGYNYDDEPESEFAKEADKKQYILGYENGWNDEGGSLPFMTKLNLIYSNDIKKYALIPIIAGFGIVGFFVGKRKKKQD